MSTITVRRSLGVPAGAAPLFEEISLPVTGKTLAQCIYLSGRFTPPALCSGLGRCGRCRVRFLSAPPPVLPGEEATLSHHNLEEGWRLACLHAPEPGQHVLIPEVSPYGACPERQGTPAALVGLPPETLSEGGVLAVDLGTTSLQWSEASEEGDGAFAEGCEINPQMGAGSDVISRLAYSLEPGGAERLRALTLAALCRIIDSLPRPPRELIVAANPAMTYIVLGLETKRLASAPYGLPYRGGETHALHGLPPLWTAPLIAPFIGGDISAGYASLVFDRTAPPPEFPFVLADLGTNGEIILALGPESALAAGVAMGPALEGINLSFGSEARPGAVVQFSITPEGLKPEVLGGAAPKAISGTGYLSLLAALKRSGLLAEDGRFCRPGRNNVPETPLTGRLAAGLEQQEPTARLRLPGRLYLDAADVEELLKAKAAFSLALSRLLDAASLTPGKLNHFFLAGALGRHAPQRALEELGFIPSGLGPKVRAIGNSSLAGACLFARDRESREKAIDWSHRVSTLDLAGDPAFAGLYANHMVFSWPHR